MYLCYMDPLLILLSIAFVGAVFEYFGWLQKIQASIARHTTPDETATGEIEWGQLLPAIVVALFLSAIVQLIFNRIAEYLATFGPAAKK